MVGRSRVKRATSKGFLCNRILATPVGRTVLREFQTS